MSAAFRSRNAVFNPRAALLGGVVTLTFLGAVAAQVPAPGQGAARLAQLFRALDANRDGKLDAQEFQGLARVAPRFQNDPQGLRTLFGRLDRDGDGALTPAEYQALAQPQTQGSLAVAPAARPVTPDPTPTAADLQFFEQKIRPVLVKQCYSCHSAEGGKPAGGLLVDTRGGLRRGGDRGAAVVPGDPDASLLIKAIRYTDSRLKMPPVKEGGKLSDSVIADFERWVRMGAPDARTEQAAAPARNWDTEKAKQHWAFQAPKKAAAPPVKNAKWPHSDIDRYVLAELEVKGLKPVADADPRTLIRRVTFDLTGLPPTPEEVDAFVRECEVKLGAKKASPNTQHLTPNAQSAYEKLVDRLLASPRFGERWGRHWLDVARYAESSGKEVNISYPHAWRYRDYVIDAFNADKPYDRFLKEQVAGDLLPYADETQHAQQLIATGYLALGPKSHNTRDARQFAMDLADEQIDALGQGVLGLTVACARCHDHKFDPISQKDYYAVAGIFLSTDTWYGTPQSIQNNRATALIPLPATAKVTPAPSLPVSQLNALRQRYDEAVQERNEILTAARQAGKQPMADPRLLRTIAVGSTLGKVLERYDESGRQIQLAMGLHESSYPRDASVLQRGELDKPQETVPRGFVQILSSGPPTIRQGSGRRELAEWLTSPSNPLTARVMANRVWLHLFGRGIVATPDNFGVMGQKPSHPALLDHLALSFVEDGWSVKKLVRRVVLSHAYQLSSDHDAADYAADPDNVLLWRMTRRPLEAEALRDAMLTAAGQLSLTAPQGSELANIEGPVQQRALIGAGIGLNPGMGMAGQGGPRGPRGPFGMGRPGGAPMAPPDPVYRSVYLPIAREQVPESLATFDFAGPSLVTGSREATTVPSQALYLLNNASVQRLSDAMALRLEKETADPEARVSGAFRLVFSRTPSSSEQTAAKRFFEQFRAAEKERARTPEGLERGALSAFCQALFASAEFRYLD